MGRGFLQTYQAKRTAVQEKNLQPPRLQRNPNKTEEKDPRKFQDRPETTHQKITAENNHKVAHVSARGETKMRPQNYDKIDVCSQIV
jgi:hypothetical protein